MVEQVIATSERTSFYILSREGTHESLYKSDGSNSSVFLTQDEGTVLPLPPFISLPLLSPSLPLPPSPLPPSLSLSLPSSPSLSSLSLPSSPSLSSPSFSSPSLSLSLLYFNVHVLSSDMESMMECFAAGSLIVEDSKFVHAREA